jgi:predicted ATPase
MNLYIISGGPCTGKTEVINKLSKQGFFTIEEAARKVGDEKFKGHIFNKKDIEEFQKAIFEYQKKKFKEAEGQLVAFTDRGFGDTIAYYKFNGLKVPKEILDYADKIKPNKVFILDPLPSYEVDTFRKEKKEEQKRIHEIIIQSYRELGYYIVDVPFMSIEERTEFIKKKIS